MCCSQERATKEHSYPWNDRRTVTEQARRLRGRPRAALLHQADPHDGRRAPRQRPIRGQELTADAGRERDVERVARRELCAETVCVREEPQERCALRAELCEEGNDPVQRAGRELSLSVEPPQGAVDLAVEVRWYRDRHVADRVRDRGAGIASG